VSLFPHFSDIIHNFEKVSQKPTGKELRGISVSAQGVWMSVTPTDDVLIAALDFKGEFGATCCQPNCNKSAPHPPNISPIPCSPSCRGAAALEVVVVSCVRILCEWILINSSHPPSQLSTAS
jgi:hypothetical protein